MHLYIKLLLLLLLFLFCLFLPVTPQHLQNTHTHKGWSFQNSLFLPLSLWGVMEMQDSSPGGFK